MVILVDQEDYRDAATEAILAERGVQLRPAFKGEAPRPGQGPVRQRIESVNQTLQGQLGLEHHLAAATAPLRP